MNRFRSFALRIRDHEEEAEIIRMGLAHEGPAIIRAAQGNPAKPLSLRMLARAIGRSACYLSRILSRQLIMGPATFKKLAEFVERQERRAAKPKAINIGAWIDQDT